MKNRPFYIAALSIYARALVTTTGLGGSSRAVCENRRWTTPNHTGTLEDRKMKIHATAIVVLAIALWITGCAKLNTAYRDFSVDDGSGAMIDVKQRAILASERMATRPPLSAQSQVQTHSPLLRLNLRLKRTSLRQ
jgi:hypothetical protein